MSRAPSPDKQPPPCSTGCSKYPPILPSHLQSVNGDCADSSSSNRHPRRIRHCAGAESQEYLFQQRGEGAEHHFSRTVRNTRGEREANPRVSSTAQREAVLDWPQSSESWFFGREAEDQEIPQSRLVGEREAYPRGHSSVGEHETLPNPTFNSSEQLTHSTPTTLVSEKLIHPAHTTPITPVSVKPTHPTHSIFTTNLIPIFTKPPVPPQVSVKLT